MKYFTEKVNPIDHYAFLVQENTEKYFDNLHRGNFGNAGVAYILCKYPKTAESIAHDLTTNLYEYPTFMWKIKPAPSPQEIRWENMSQNFVLLKIKRIIVFACFIVIFFVFMTPTIVLRNLDESLQDFVGEKFLSTYLPSLVMLVYESVILKYSIVYMGSFEAHTSEASETLGHLRKYLIFMSIYVFVYPILGDQALSVLSKGYHEIRFIIAESLLESAQFYVIFLIQKTFIHNGVELLQLPKIIKVKIALARASNTIERTMAHQAGHCNIGYNIASLLTCFMMVMCFSVIYPLIIGIGLLYFCMSVSCM